MIVVIDSSTGTLSWETALVALGMAAYFVVRRALGTNTLAGFWLDVLLMSPGAVFMIINHERDRRVRNSCVKVSLPASRPRASQCSGFRQLHTCKQTFTHEHIRAAWLP